MNIQKYIATVFVNSYSIIMELIRFAVLPFLKNTGKRKGWDLVDRQKMPVAVRDHRKKNVVWLHGASLGEAKLLYKFIDVLQKRHPEDYYLVTAMTRAGLDYLRKNNPPAVCAVGYLPFDTLSLMRKVVDRFNITRVWLLETELWPSMVWTCIRGDIPIGVVNARLEEKSFKNFSRLRVILKYLFGFLDIVLAQNELYASRFEELGVPPEKIHVVGNIKGHVSINRPDVHEWQKVRNALNLNDKDFVITAGCAHAGEGKILRHCFDQLKEFNSNCKMIVIPRYLDEVPVLMEETGNIAIHLNEISTHQEWDMCIVGKLGILDDMYKIADSAIVCGTFTDIGGHNVWDAARFGIPVFFGPDYRTQSDSCETLITAGVGFSVSNGDHLAEKIFTVMKTDAKNFVSSQVAFIDKVNKSQSVLEPLIP